MWRKLISTPEDPLLTFLRVALFVVFIPHGMQKAFGWFGGPGYAGTMNFFTSQQIPAFLAFLAIAAEFAGAIALFFGLLTRVAAFGLACNMVVAITTTHWQNGFFMNWAGNQRGEGFEYHLLAITLLLAVMVRGAGAWSVDRAVWLSSEMRARREIGLRRTA
ncbi:MAG: DoxX family protein [Bdellovibrionota bacterium]